MTANTQSHETGSLVFHGEISQEQQQILSPEAVALLTELVEKFAPQVDELLNQRVKKQARMDAGELPDFLPETAHIRDGDWSIQGIPEKLLDRRVEITGPVDRKMVINALNARVKVFMADFEDSFAPTWSGVLDGQVNLRDAINGTIEYTNPGNGKHYKLDDDPATLICRVRGLHLPEKHITFNGKIVPGCLVDFALYFVNNYETLLAKGAGPYFYVPKLQSHHESKWWSEVFSYAEDKFNLARGTIKATLLIETIPAAFEMEEILYSMKEHIVALNCGRWDYIFSYIKTLRKHADRVLPDRHSVTMDKPFLSAYSRLLIKTCHKRGALAMGGMAAFIPAKTEEENDKVLTKVTADKTLEAQNGHDGTWVAHPGLADTAMGVLNEYIGEGNANQLHITREDDAPVTAADLLEPCSGERTETGMRLNIRIGVRYMEAWISGNGCVPIYGLMEDAATAEISRASIWQWIQHEKTLSNGKVVTKDLFRQLLQEELAVIREEEIGAEAYDNGRFAEASKLFEELTTSDQLAEFLTLPGYDFLD
jgi:malate synthase